MAISFPKDDNTGHRVMVTGGAGFIGSHLVSRLLDEGHVVTVLDNFRTGSLRNLGNLLAEQKLALIRGDCLNVEDLNRAVANCEIIYHLAANPEVRVGQTDSRVDFEQNILCTFNVLETMRRSNSAKKLVFTSTSTVYGEALQLPTPEDYGPLEPISMYGASKLACESLIAGYSHMYGLNSVICRFANVVGRRSRHGAVYDFILKLRNNPTKMEILGDGSQTKSYLHVSDCIDGLVLCTRHAKKRVGIFNIGTEDQVTVGRIAQIVASEMDLGNASVSYTGGVDGGRGWKGDIKRMLLDISRIKQLGWNPKLNSEEAIRFATRELLEEFEGDHKGDLTDPDII